jgi:hypothetical protein
MVPPRERLNAKQSAAGDLDDRLVPQLERFFAQRLSEFDIQLESGTCLGRE